MVLGLKEFGFGNIEGGEGSVEVEMESVGISRLAIGQAGELLGISKEKLNGLLTNDKFCLSRYGRLHLNWWRRPLRLR